MSEAPLTQSAVMATVDKLIAAGTPESLAAAGKLARQYDKTAAARGAAAPLGHATMEAAMAQGQQQAPAAQPYAAADLLDLAALQKMSLPEYEQIRSTAEGRKRLDASYAAQGLPAIEQAKS